MGKITINKMKNLRLLKEMAIRGSELIPAQDLLDALADPDKVRDMTKRYKKEDFKLVKHLFARTNYSFIFKLFGLIYHNPNLFCNLYRMSSLMLYTKDEATIKKKARAAKDSQFIVVYGSLRGKLLMVYTKKGYDLNEYPICTCKYPYDTFIIDVYAGCVERALNLFPDRITYLDKFIKIYDPSHIGLLFKKRG
jgi:hypothetical protein